MCSVHTQDKDSLRAHSSDTPRQQQRVQGTSAALSPPVHAGNQSLLHGTLLLWLRLSFHHLHFLPCPAQTFPLGSTAWIFLISCQPSLGTAPPCCPSIPVHPRTPAALTLQPGTHPGPQIQLQQITELLEEN